jgi:uncharacterized protein YjbI with pentapeptide repeats/beta-lactamase regulating signal transducer with metallopeptidase domain
MLGGSLASIATPVAAIALNALWEGALLVAGVWLLVRSWPQINASTRYTIWSATLVAIVLVPVATTLPFLESPSPASSQATEKVVRVAPVTHTLTTTLSPKLSAPETNHVASAAPAPALPPRFHLTMPASLAVAVFALWGLLVAASLVRLAVGLVRLEQLKRDALPLPVEYRDAMDRWMCAKKGSRDVRLCVSDEIDVPVAVGLFDAMILIPSSLLMRLSTAEVDQISLHELAHLRRADDWSNGFQRVAVALLGWNPAALFVSQQLDLEREVACDDWVLSLTGTVRPYALCLTKMAETSAWPRQPMPAPGVFASRKHISMRIERLLGVGRNIATGLSFGPTATALAVVGALAFVIQLVAPSIAAPTPNASVSQTPQQANAPVIVRLPTLKEVKEVRVLVYVTPSPAVMPTALRVPPMNVHVPGTNVHVPEMNVHVPEMNVHAPAVNVNVHVPGVDIPLSKYEKFDKARFDEMLHRSIARADARSSASASAAGVPSCNSCDFSGVDWSGHDMQGVRYVGVDLSQARLEHTNFSGGQFSGVDFSHSRLAGASFRNAVLSGCDFSDADLTGVDFTGVKMSGCEFTNARLTSSTLRDVLNSCTGCDFSNANLAGLNLSGVRASGDDFTKANLRGVNFNGAYLTGMDFSDADLDGASLSGTTLNGCDLSGANLRGVDVSRTTFIGTDFSERSSERQSPEP